MQGKNLKIYLMLCLLSLWNILDEIHDNWKLSQHESIVLWVPWFHWRLQFLWTKTVDDFIGNDSWNEHKWNIILRHKIVFKIQHMIGCRVLLFSNEKYKSACIKRNVLKPIWKRVSCNSLKEVIFWWITIDHRIVLQLCRAKMWKTILYVFLVVVLSWSSMLWKFQKGTSMKKSLAWQRFYF